MRNLFSLTILAIVVFFAASSMAADKVVVIPINKCGDGLTKCSDQCVDTLNNPSFCGDCSTDCGAGNFCSQGICKKPSASGCTTSSDCLHGICTNNICYEVKRVFVTSANYTGDLGGLVGADSKCQALADSAGLDGNYKAWLSNNTESPSTRFTKAIVPYVRTDDVRIADDWTALTTTDLLTAIDKDETGVTYTGAPWAWTNTNSAGTLRYPDSAQTCTEWSSSSASQTGRFGIISLLTSGWSGTGSVNCDIPEALYCFQQ